MRNEKTTRNGLNRSTLFASGMANLLMEPRSGVVGRYGFFADAEDTVPFLKRGKNGDVVTRV